MCRRLLSVYWLTVIDLTPLASTGAKCRSGAHLSCFQLAICPQGRLLTTARMLLMIGPVGRTICNRASLGGTVTEARSLQVIPITGTLSGSSVLDRAAPLQVEARSILR